MTEVLHNRLFQLEHLKDITSVSGLSLSADGKWLAYVKTSVAAVQNDYTDEVIIVNLDTHKQVASWPGSSPLWSPASNVLAYLDEHQGSTYIWLYSPEEKKKQPVAPIYESHYFMGHLALKNYSWSPNGCFIAYISADRTPVAASQDVIVADRLLYKTKGGRVRPQIADELLSHVCVADIQSGTTTVVTPGAYNEHSLCWAPDSQHIAFVSNRTNDPDDNQLYDLYSVDLRTNAVSQHTAGFGTVYQPAWSPDGRQIAFLGTTSKISTNDSPAEDTHLFVVSLHNDQVQPLTKPLDRRVEQIRWHPKSDVIFFTAGDRGTTAIYRVGSDGAGLQKVVGDKCQVLEYVVHPAGDRLCYVSMDIDHLTDIFQYNLSAGSTQQLTNNTANFTKHLSLQSGETFWFKSFDGKDVQGWLMKPAGFKPDRTYPLVLVIHGGPHNMFGYGFEDRLQLLAAYGYGVLYINPRGSHGYGQAFSNGCVMAWGQADYQDLMAGVDAALKQNEWIEPERLGVTGQSYGGYMSNRIITNTNRFKAAVVDGGISNLISFAGTSLYHSLIESEFNGSAYDNFSLLWDCSPLKDVKNVQTPTLFLHGETDNEVPVTQAEEMYIALKKLGVQTKMVQYKGEGHGWRPDLKPANRYDLLKRMIEWFDKYLKKDAR